MFNMGLLSFICVSTLSILCFCSLIHAQQPYVGKATTNCTDLDNNVRGYSCNGMSRSCQAYLLFRSQPPYNTVANISTLLASDQSQLSEINSVSETATFETNKMVIVPVNCSCSGAQYYQVNASYVVQTGNTYFEIANNTFQGLSTCQALVEQNGYENNNLPADARVVVPVRCACPTKNQTDVGVRYLLSYLVTWKDTVNAISTRFGVDTGKTLEANELSEQDIINPFTTLLVPLQNPPSVSQTEEPPPSPSSTPPPAPPPNSSSNGSSNKTWIYILVGVLAGSVVILIFSIIIFCTFFRKGEKKTDSVIVSESPEAREKPLRKKLDEESQDFFDTMSSIAQSLKVYTFKELQSATDNFNPSCWIKGSVYRGTINGDFAAIKKVNGDVSKEINLLNKFNHSNLIRICGVCFNEADWYLVYEFAINGQLSDWIYENKNEGKFLNWAQRIQIALDVATGLNYLHSFTKPPHVHKNIKSSNVLLDGDFRAKIANFALARPTEEAEGEFALTRHIVGTKGYMAPEYLENGIVSTKLDVYAFGVVMLEILTGKDAAALYGEENMHLSEALNVVLNKEDGQESLRSFVDLGMKGNYPPELAILVIRLIDNCLEKNPTNRPAMDEIVQSLSRILNASRTWELLHNISGY